MTGSMNGILAQALTSGAPEGMNTNMVLQYVAVGLILAAACVWLIVRIWKRGRTSREGDCDSCPTCALKEKCSSPQRGKKH